jgi:maleylpyruvate isomerase
MVTRTRSDAARWMHQGTSLFADVLAGLDDDAFSEPLRLPGWTRRHLLAHVAANADALGNLVHWAATGEETPMYASSAQRNADIERGSHRSPGDLREWVSASARQLAEDFASLTEDQLDSEVRTAQGRSIPAGDIAWLRAREVMVHAVDLAAGDGHGVGFDDLPPDFLLALVDDIVGKRSGGSGPTLRLVPDDAAKRWTLDGDGEPSTVDAHLADIAAYLAGRASALDGSVPALPRWL